MNKAKISVFALVMLMTGAVDGVTNLPSIAIFGQQLIFFFLIASVLFLLPTGLISAELCTQFKEDSGVYVWSKKAFGGHFGALTIWLQWINTLVFFPTILTTIAGTAAYLINPKLTHNTYYLVGTSLAALWIMTILNLKGIKESANMVSIAAMLGMVIPMATIIGLSILWLLTGKPQAIHLSSKAILPNLSHSNAWSSLTAIITSFLGMELAAVHVKKVKNAGKVFPKALMYSIIVIVVTMGFGSLAVAFVIPHQQIALVSGTIQAFNTMFIAFHLHWMEKILGIMLLCGSLGTMVTWLISPANGLAQAAHDVYLPKTLAKENKHGVPYKILILQAIIASVVCLAFFLLPTINGSYWLLLDLSTEIYVIMYVLMFASALKLINNAKITNIIPGKKNNAMIIATLGILGCLIAIVVGFFPPSHINVGSHWHYIMLFTLGLIIMISPAILLSWHKAKFGVDDYLMLDKSVTNN